MERSFTVQCELFIRPVDLDDPALCELAGMDAVLYWGRLESLMFATDAALLGISAICVSLFLGVITGHLVRVCLMFSS